VRRAHAKPKAPAPHPRRVRQHSLRLQARLALARHLLQHAGARSDARSNACAGAARRGKPLPRVLTQSSTRGPRAGQQGRAAQQGSAAPSAERRAPSAVSAPAAQPQAVRRPPCALRPPLPRCFASHAQPSPWLARLQASQRRRSREQEAPCNRKSLTVRRWHACRGTRRATHRSLPARYAASRPARGARAQRWEGRSLGSSAVRRKTQKKGTGPFRMNSVV
jgi:hypothetical protein